MSRSYKKHPFYTDHGTPRTRNSKRSASKKVRQYKNKIINGNFYKKIFCSYNIHDYISRWSWDEAKAIYYNQEDCSKYYPTIQEFYKFWIKNYKIK